MRYADVHALKASLGVELNVEGYPSPEFMELVLDVQPAQVTLVPDPPGALTSNAGWDARAEEAILRRIIGQLHQAGIRTSLFIEAAGEAVRAAQQTGADRVELYTGPYAAHYARGPEQAIAPYRVAAEVAEQLGLGLNAGHDLNLENLAYFRQHIPGLLEVSIGHALTVDALYLGVAETVKQYLSCLR